MKAITTLAVGVLALCSQVRAADVPVQVFLLGGQSNMVGVGKTSELGAAARKPVPGVKIWRGGGWPALAPAGKSFGPELSFGRALEGRLGAAEIRLVKYAASGTALYNDWSPKGGPQYKRFMDTARAALADLEASGIEFEIAGMLWMQGESDAQEGKGAEYEANLRAFIAHMREQFDAPQMSFAIGRVKDFYGRKNGGAKLVRDAQRRVAETTPNVEWFDTDGYSLFNAGHYDGPGLIEMGKDFAKAVRGGG